MYKVFVNEKKLLLSKQSEALEKTLKYDSFTTLEIALDLSSKHIGKRTERIWGKY